MYHNICGNGDFLSSQHTGKNTYKKSEKATCTYNSYENQSALNILVISKKEENIHIEYKRSNEWVSWLC
jgi:hypothetical protein